MTSIKPSRGDIWLVDLNPTRGREQAGKRPCLVVSVGVERLFQKLGIVSATTMNMVEERLRILLGL